MSKKEIDEIDKYCTPYSLLVIVFSGELKRLYCPFTVIVLIPIDRLKTNEKAIVTQVKMDKHFILVYVINGTAYYYYNFAICL